MKNERMAAKSRLWILLVASLILPEPARAQERPTVIRATTLLDGKGGIMRNVSIVVQGTLITRIDPNAQGATYDLKASCTSAATGPPSTEPTPCAM